MHNFNQHLITVVIATLGGDSLKDTIVALNQGSIVPAEILICIPVIEAPKVEDIQSQNSNVKILITQCRGQVAQRAVGFQNASHDIVMQLDDDLIVDVDCISHLLKTFKVHNPKVGVAPALMNHVNRQSIYKKFDTNIILQKMYYWLMNGKDGYQPGIITQCGSVIGVGPQNNNERIFEVEWLAGGCIMHHKENLILTNYYPFEGKAYYEDIIHSHYLRKVGIKLIVDVNAHCWMEPPLQQNGSVVQFIKQLKSDFQARKYTMQLLSRMTFRIYLFYIGRIISYTIKRISTGNDR